MNIQSSPQAQLTHRLAEFYDIDNIIFLIQLSIEKNMREFLSEEEVEAAKDSMGIDHSLLNDRTYFIIEAVSNDEKIIVGCGGWGKRKTLYGGDHTVGRDDSISDPNKDPARIRAMYTHPDWTRKGVGSLLLKLGENSARDAGFKTIELGSTIPGEPFYQAKGYIELERKVTLSSNGTEDTIIKMSKKL